MKKIKIACLGNYPPRRCGIATFTKNFLDSVVNNNKEKTIQAEAYVVTLDEQDQQFNYPDEVKHVIRKNHQRDYLKAAEFINYSDADICFLQHEFGIFGGDSGIYILPLIYRLKIPLIVIFHTVLKDPDYDQKAIVQEIGKRAEKIVVMSNQAIEFLNEIYDIDKEKVELIEHGVPDVHFRAGNNHKKKFHLENKKVLFTFGLLNRNKGIETVISALPKVVEKHPELMYIVLGKTHPVVLRASGEEYRNYLKLLVLRNNLRKYVYFDDRFVSTEELISYLSATDIYITPYLNEAQITSGTLSYAVGAGTAVISTPYLHARELLADGRGRLFNFQDSDKLAEIINELLDNPEKLLRLRKNAYNYGRKTIWEEIGICYLNLAAGVIESFTEKRVEEEQIINPLVLPKFNLGHVKRLTDNTGIIQHAKFSVPNYKEGYSLDDNARALLMSLLAYRQMKDGQALDLMPVYLSYIHYMQNDDGTFRNLLSFSREFLDETGSEDSFGRTIWALGYLIRFPPTDAYLQLGKEMFSKAYPNFEKLKYIRGMANSLIGIYHYLKRFPSDEGMIITLKSLTQKIIQKYEAEKREDWRWFEPMLTYDNGIIPLSLLHAYEVTGNEKTLSVAKESMEFLEKTAFKEEGYISLVGSDSWYEKNGIHSQYAQQPINAMAKVLMFYQAYIVIRDRQYLNKMFGTFMWFLGENDLRIPLYDFETSGCNDGLESHGVNRNQGAESTLAYLIAHLAVLFAYELAGK